MSIILTISADTPEDFTHKLSALHAFARPPERAPAAATVDLTDQAPAPAPAPATKPKSGAQLDMDRAQAILDEVPVPVADEAPKRRPGRPRKADKPEPVDTLATVDEAAPDPELEPETGDERDPAQDFDTAMDLLRTIYSRPDAMPHVTGLLSKYDVAKFSQIPSAMGTDLLTDARLLNEKVPM